jgi:thiol-disulfide isomerase/thioredoxin
MDAFEARRPVLGQRAEPVGVHRVDRLSPVARRAGLAALAASVALLVGCGGEDSGGGAPLPSRVNAVKATKPTASAHEWCDVYFEPGKGPRLAPPQLEDARDGGAVAGLTGDGWIWVNLWATWCGPCLREMPLITRWMETLGNDGIRVTLWFVSVDEERETLHAFLRERPGVTPYNTTRLVSQDALQPWLASLGLKPDTGIPVNVLAGPDGLVRCVRTGSINDGHYPTIRAFLGEAR